MVVSKKTWYLWYFKVFPLLSALIVALLLWLCDLVNLFRIWIAITAYFFVYLKLPYRNFKGRDDIGVIIVGGGLSGLCAAVKMGQLGVKYVMLERSDGVGGVWKDAAAYPGAAADTPSHLFTFSFFPNPMWKSSFLTQSDFLGYLESVAKFFNIYRNVVFNKEVEVAIWDEETQKWSVTCVDGEIYRANFLISACGTFQVPSYSDLKGMQDYNGIIMHSSRWRSDIDITNKKVAVIGTGASTVQIVPNIDEKADEVMVFQRTPCFVPDDTAKTSVVYPERIQRLFTWFPLALYIERWVAFWRDELLFYTAFDSRRKEMGRKKRKQVEDEMRTALAIVKVPDPDRFIPKNEELGCKRVAPSHSYLQSFGRPNVRLITSKIDRLFSTGIRTVDGHEFDTDIIVCATGFDVHSAMRLAFRVIGRYGRDLSIDWADTPAAFNGVMIPNYPNFFRLMGPNTYPGQSSVSYMAECQCTFIAECIRQTIGGGYRSLDVNTRAMEKHMDMVLRTMRHKVFVTGSCHSWYQNSRGVVYTQWPSDLTHFWWRTRRCNLAQFNVK